MEPSVMIEIVYITVLSGIVANIMDVETRHKVDI